MRSAGTQLTLPRRLSALLGSRMNPIPTARITNHKSLIENRSSRIETRKSRIGNGKPAIETQQSKTDNRSGRPHSPTSVIGIARSEDESNTDCENPKSQIANRKSEFGNGPMTRSPDAPPPLTLFDSRQHTGFDRLIAEWYSSSCREALPTFQCRASRGRWRPEVK